MPAWQPAGSERKYGQSNALLHMMGAKHGYMADSAESVYRQEFAIDCK